MLKPGDRVKVIYIRPGSDVVYNTLINCILTVKKVANSAGIVTKEYPHLFFFNEELQLISKIRNKPGERI